MRSKFFYRKILTCRAWATKHGTEAHWNGCHQLPTVKQYLGRIDLDISSPANMWSNLWPMSVCEQSDPQKNERAWQARKSEAHWSAAEHYNFVSQLITIDILTSQSEYVGLWNRHFGQVAHILEVATCRTFQWVHFSCSKLPSKQALSLNYYSNHQFSVLFVLQDSDNIAVKDWCHPTWQVQYAIASMAEMIYQISYINNHVELNWFCMMQGIQKEYPTVVLPCRVQSTWQT